MGGVRKWFRPKQPPPPIRELSASESIASKYTPINFVNIMDGLMGDKLEECPQSVILMKEQ
jgi:hypothetical protein